MVATFTIRLTCKETRIPRQFYGSHHVTHDRSLQVWLDQASEPTNWLAQGTTQREHLEGVLETVIRHTMYRALEKTAPGETIYSVRATIRSSQAQRQTSQIRGPNPSLAPIGERVGGRVWRREWDSNPRYGFPYTRFPSERLQPLGHLSDACEPCRRTAQYSGGLRPDNPSSPTVHCPPIWNLFHALPLSSR